jgi:predicted lactoylglutathione lyase
MPQIDQRKLQNASKFVLLKDQLTFVSGPDLMNWLGFRPAHPKRKKRKLTMIAYTTIGTNDFAKATKFYDALLGELGAGRAMENDRFVAYATGEGQPMFGVTLPENGKEATSGNGAMIALGAENPAAVDRLYAKAIELGATDEGAPGVRLDSFYIGYIRDLDGNKLNFFTPAA